MSCAARSLCVSNTTMVSPGGQLLRRPRAMLGASHRGTRVRSSGQLDGLPYGYSLGGPVRATASRSRRSRLAVVVMSLSTLEDEVNGVGGRIGPSHDVDSAGSHLSPDAARRRATRRRERV